MTLFEEFNWFYPIFLLKQVLRTDICKRMGLATINGHFVLKFPKQSGKIKVIKLVSIKMLSKIINTGVRAVLHHFSERSESAFKEKSF